MSKNLIGLMLSVLGLVIQLTILITIIVIDAPKLDNSHIYVMEPKQTTGMELISYSKDSFIIIRNNHYIFKVDSVINNF